MGILTRINFTLFSLGQAPLHCAHILSFLVIIFTRQVGSGNTACLPYQEPYHFDIVSSICLAFMCLS
jgi:hypothetical protein